MARFDVYAGVGAEEGYVVGVQAPLLYDLATRIVIPLLPRDTTLAVRELNPTVDVGGRSFMLMTQELAAIPSSLLRQPVVSLADRRDDITRALDTLFTGF